MPPIEFFADGKYLQYLHYRQCNYLQTHISYNLVWDCVLASFFHFTSYWLAPKSSSSDRQCHSAKKTTWSSIDSCIGDSPFASPLVSCCTASTLKVSFTVSSDCLQRTDSACVWLVRQAFAFLVCLLCCWCQVQLTCTTDGGGRGPLYFFLLCLQQSLMVLLVVRSSRCADDIRVLMMLCNRRARPANAPHMHDDDDQ